MRMSVAPTSRSAAMASGLSKSSRACKTHVCHLAPDQQNMASRDARLLAVEPNRCLFDFARMAKLGRDVVGLQVGELRDDLVMLIWSGTTGVGPPGKVLDAVGRPVVIASGNLVFALNPWVREQALAGLS